MTLTILLIAAAAIAFFVLRGQAIQRNRSVERASEEAVRRRQGDGGPTLMIGDGGSDGGRRGGDRDNSDGDRADAGSDSGGDGGGGGGD